MVRGEKFSYNLHGLSHSISVGSQSIHGKHFHPLFDWMLTRGQQFALGGSPAVFLTIDLHDAESANRYWDHVRLMAQNRDWYLFLVSQLFHIKLPRGVIDR